MLGFLVIQFDDSVFHLQCKDIPVFPIGSKVYYAKGCEEGGTVTRYDLNMDEGLPYFCCYLDDVGVGNSSDVIGEKTNETWETWLVENGYTKGVPMVDASSLTSSESIGLPILLDAKEVADTLGMLRSRVIRMANARQIPSVRLPGGEPRFIPEDIRAWVSALRIPATV